jgi:hypothetical protein
MVPHLLIALEMIRAGKAFPARAKVNRNARANAALKRHY